MTFQLAPPSIPSPSSDPTSSYNPHASSIDTSRIIRADYSNPLYTRLADEAQQYWRTKFSRNGIYRESGLAIVGEEGKSGWEYIDKSRHNVASHARGLDSPEAIREAVKTGGSSGSAGYINYESGWADASAAMGVFRQRVSDLAKASGRDLWKRGKAVELLYSEPVSSKPPRVEGVRLSSGEILSASLTILAAGAWTGSLIDLRGRAEATAQVLSYVNLSASERERLQSMPVVLNLGNGLFAMPPSPATDSTLKIARHGYGYRNPTSIKDPLTGQVRSVSLPSEKFSLVPFEGESDCKQFLKCIVPWLADREFCHTRLCWYTDTPTGDFIIDYHPEIEGLFLVTGGSGHGFKFLPVIGELIVQALEKRLDRDWRDLWAWKEAVEGFEACEDGSRGGKRGMLLEEEWSFGNKDRKPEGKTSRL